MKRWGLVLLTIVLLVSLTGCDALQRKFTRKNKAPVKRPRFYQVKKYTRKPSPLLYKQHYEYWASWQDQLIQVIGENHKKDKQCIEEAVGNLKDMQSILIPSKAEEMQVHIEKMEAAKEVIFKGDLSFANKDDIRRTLEREDRAIKRDFCYAKVKDCLRKEQDDDSPPKANMPESTK